MSNFTTKDVETHRRFVVDIRVQEVTTTLSTQVPISRLVAGGNVAKTQRDVIELAHYVLSETDLAAALAKGMQLLRLTGTQSAGD